MHKAGRQQGRKAGEMRKVADPRMWADAPIRNAEMRLGRSPISISISNQQLAIGN